MVFSGAIDHLRPSDNRKGEKQRARLDDRYIPIGIRWSHLADSGAMTDWTKIAMRPIPISYNLREI